MWRIHISRDNENIEVCTCTKNEAKINTNKVTWKCNHIIQSIHVSACTHLGQHFVGYYMWHRLHGRPLVDYVNSSVVYLCKEMNRGFNWWRTETWSSGHCFAGPRVTCLMHLPVSTAFNTLWVNIDPFPAQTKGQHVYCTSRPSPLGECKPTLIRFTTRNFKSVLAQRYSTHWWFNTSMWDLSSLFPSIWGHGKVCYRLM